MNFDSSHDNNIVIMSQMIGHKMIFFSDKNQNNQFTIKDSESVIYLNSLYSRDDSKSEYASSNYKRFYSEQELNAFMTTIKSYR